MSKNIVGALFSNSMISACFLFSMALGIKSVIEGDVLPVIAFIVGGGVGTYLGIINGENKGWIKRVLGRSQKK